jgi:hypothetical protein
VSQDNATERSKQDVLELAAISKECPENLQERCFELLLTRYLDGLRVKSDGKKKADETEKETDLDDKPESEVGDPAEEKPPASGSDLALKHLHVKAKKFLEKSGTTLEDLNEIFYREGDELRPLYEDLKTTKASASQIRIALLQSLASGIKSGEFEFDGEEVRKECQARKCYDATNFSANFKNSADLFESFEKYDKQQPVVKLSEAGRKAVAKAVTELR